MAGEAGFGVWVVEGCLGAEGAGGGVFWGRAVFGFALFAAI